MDKNDKEQKTDYYCNSSGYRGEDDGGASLGFEKSCDMEAHVELISKEAAKQREVQKWRLRAKLEEIRAEIRSNKENGLNPLLIFPEEVWIIIFQYITDGDDLLNCSKTCRLFQRLLGGDNVQLLFGKVFPFISKHLNKYQVKLCRQICKRWCSGLDKSLECYYSAVPDPPNDIVEQLTDNRDLPRKTPKDLNFWCKIRDDRKWMMLRRSRAEIRKHPRNPFVGRAAKIEAESRHGDDNTNFFQEFGPTFLEFGSHLWSLSLSDFCVSLSLSGIYSLCLQCLYGCQNLRTFRLENFRWANLSIPKDELEERFDALPLPPSQQYLHSLAVLIEHPHVLLLQDKLIERYSGQLKQLEVHFWNTDLYHNLNWENLLELHVLQGNCVELLESLKETKAPNLRKLSIRLDGSDPGLQYFIQLTHHFPRLSHLHLKFSDGFIGFSDDEILSSPPNLIASSCLTTLEITHSEVELCYNFLILFPLVNQLIIEKGAVASSRRLLYEDKRGHGRRRQIRGGVYVEDDLDFNFEVGAVANGMGLLDLEEEEEDDDDDVEDYMFHGRDEDEISIEAPAAAASEEEDDDGGDLDLDWLKDDEVSDEEVDGDDLSEEDGEVYLLLPKKPKKEDEAAAPGDAKEDDGGQSSNEDSDGDSSEREPESEAEVIEKSARRSRRNCPTSSFVKISKRLEKSQPVKNSHDKSNLDDKYPSNIWRILPSLQVVKVCIPERPNMPEFDKLYVCTRELYNWENVDQWTRIHNRYRLVQNDVTFQQKEVREVIRNNLICRRDLIQQMVASKSGRKPAVLDWDDEDEPGDTELLFEDVLPLILPYLDRKDVLSCRLVCQSWSWGIGYFLQDYLDVEDSSLTIMADEPYTGLELPRKPFQFEYTFHIPFQSPEGQDKVIKEMVAHDRDRNPFIGGVVSIVLTSTRRNHFERTLRQVSALLKRFGKHIFHLKLSSSSTFKPITPVNFYRLIGRILKGCRHLYTLHLSHVGVDWPRDKWDVVIAMMNLDMFEPCLRPHRNLKSLIVHEDNPAIVAIQDRLLDMTCEQLERLDVTCWREDTTWNFMEKSELKELIIPGRQEIRWLYEWEGITELRKLGLRLTEEYPNLDPLIFLVDYFFNSLEKVELVFGEGCKGFTSNKVMNIDTNRLSWSPLLTNLELTMEHNASTLFDFLIYFPYLKRLCIRYVVEGNGSTNHGDLEEGCGEKNDKHQSIFVQLDNNFGGKGEGGEGEDMSSRIYASNIWQVLARLEFLEIMQTSSSSSLDCGRRTVYSRKGYDFFKKEM